MTGLRVRHHGTVTRDATMVADLVIDCSGRRSRTPSRLEELGYDAPVREGLPVDVHDVTRHDRLPDTTLTVTSSPFAGPTPEEPRGGEMMQIEGGQWVVTPFG